MVLHVMSSQQIVLYLLSFSRVQVAEYCTFISLKCLLVFKRLARHSLPSEFLSRLFLTLLWFRVSWLEGNVALSFNEPESVWSCPLPVLFCPAASVMKSRVREGWESGLGTDLQPKAFSTTFLIPSILRGNIEDLGWVINEPV